MTYDSEVGTKGEKNVKTNVFRRTELKFLLFIFKDQLSFFILPNSMFLTFYIGCQGYGDCSGKALVMSHGPVATMTFAEERGFAIYIVIKDLTN